MDKKVIWSQDGSTIEIAEVPDDHISIQTAVPGADAPNREIRFDRYDLPAVIEALLRFPVDVHVSTVKVPDLNLLDDALENEIQRRRDKGYKVKSVTTPVWSSDDGEWFTFVYSEK